jgi:hypothetical protein
LGFSLSADWVVTPEDRSRARLRGDEFFEIFCRKHLIGVVTEASEHLFDLVRVALGDVVCLLGIVDDIVQFLARERGVRDQFPFS